MVDPLKVVVALREFTRVDDLSVCEQHEMIEHRDDIAPRLVNSEHNSAVVITGERREGFHNVVRIIRVQTAGRFVKKQDRGARDKLASDRNTALLATGDGPMTCQRINIGNYYHSTDLPEEPIVISLIPRIPSSCMVSNVLNFFASRLISLGSLNSAEYRTVS